MATGKQDEFGVIGLGRMGGNLALQALGKGISRRRILKGGDSRELQAAGVIATDSLDEFARQLQSPRKDLVLRSRQGRRSTASSTASSRCSRRETFWSDGGNSYWGDSIRRFERLKAHSGSISSTPERAAASAVHATARASW